MQTTQLARLGVLLAALAGGLAMSRPAAAQINSYGSGLQSSETLSTPPERRQGGYWNSTSANRSTPRRGGAQASGTARSDAGQAAASPPVSRAGGTPR